MYYMELAEELKADGRALTAKAADAIEGQEGYIQAAHKTIERLKAELDQVKAEKYKIRTSREELTIPEVISRLEERYRLLDELRQRAGNGNGYHDQVC